MSASDIRDYVRRVASTYFHPVGTCRMGADERAVVDHRLKLRGLSNLRVADASIMPEIVSGNTNAPAMMIGWRAAEFALEDAGIPVSCGRYLPAAGPDSMRFLLSVAALIERLASESHFWGTSGSKASYSSSATALEAHPQNTASTGTDRQPGFPAGRSPGRPGAHDRVSEAYRIGPAGCVRRMPLHLH